MKNEKERSSTKELQLKKKLLMYSLAAGVTISFSAKAHGAIQYTNIDDVTINHAPNHGTNDYSLDMNNDFTPEFKIFQSYNISYKTTTTMMTTTSSSWPSTNRYTTASNDNVNQSAINNGLAVMKGNFAYLGACVAALEQSALISANKSFSTNQVLAQWTFSQYTQYGLWPGQGQKFMGVKFKIGENIHYGWVRLSVAADCQSFIVYDYAYEGIAGRGIKAGQTEGTLPVELSMFTAQFLNNKPTLYWTTQSETDNMGWNIYRNTENNFSSAKKISDFIDGHGSTTQMQSYLFEDESENLEIGQTYYYWLESIDYGGMINHFNLIAQLTIPHHNDPGQHITPPVSYDISIKPNPIVASTKISFVSKEAGYVEGAIYNIKGELVKSFDAKHVNADQSLSYVWDGKDDKDKVQSNGIYLFAMKVNEKAPNISRLILMR